MNKKNAPTNVEDYITNFPLEVQKLLQTMRVCIQKAAPEATEGLSYGMPAFKLHGPLVYFGAFKNHLGFYATPTGHQAFETDLAPYKQGKGSVQFPLDQALPLDLIERIVVFRVQENKKKMQLKKK